jgi:hypothetical protein
MEKNSIAGRVMNLPPGLVGCPTAFLGRYREFDDHFDAVLVPPGSEKRRGLGCDVGYSFNLLADHMLANPDFQWLWILGDDHSFAPDLWLRLYERNVDVVVPLCLRKNDRAPVFNCGPDGGFVPDPNRWEVLRGKSGLMQWKGTVGNAGMLIRRRVFEKMNPPYFRQGQLDPRYSSSDIWFSWALQEAGFTLWIDLDNLIGHIEHVAYWPRRDEKGNWYFDVMPAAGIPEPQPGQGGDPPPLPPDLGAIGQAISHWPHADLHQGNLVLADESISLSPGAYIDLTGSVEISSYAMIGEGTRILTHDHYHDGRTPLLLLQQAKGVKWMDKRIGTDVWLHGCTVLMQVTEIPDGVIVGAGSVLTHNPEPYGIYAGNPARKIGER